LKRLQVDCVDLYQLHWPNRGSYHFRKYWTYDPTDQQPGDFDQEIADILGEVARLQQEGKLREFGLSNESAWGTVKFLQASDNHRLPRIASIQNEYNLTCRIFDLDLAEVSIRENVGLMAYSPLAAGGLTGKSLDGDIPAGCRRSMQPSLNGRYIPEAEKVIRLYRDVAQNYGIDLTQMALAFCLKRPFMMSIIIGATSMAQLKTNIGAKDVKLDEQILADIQAIYRQYPMPV
jgi:aryl-alcohol dehydrogenase-like predicted oxidoreductase